MWKLSFKPSAFHALSANVPKNDLPRVLRGLDQLCADPLPNGRERRKLSGGDGLFRCKVHGFRVMYVFDDSHVSVLDVRAREDDHATYGSLPEPEHLGAGPDAELPDEDDGASYLPPRDEAPAGETPLESPITEELLAALRVPEAHHAALLGCATEEALLDCDVALRLLPDRPEILDSRALAYWLLGDKEKARQDLERAHQLDSSSPTWEERFREFEEMF